MYLRCCMQVLHFVFLEVAIQGLPTCPIRGGQVWSISNSFWPCQGIRKSESTCCRSRGVRRPGVVGRSYGIYEEVRRLRIVKARSSVREWNRLSPVIVRALSGYTCFYSREGSLCIAQVVAAPQLHDEHTRYHQGRRPSLSQNPPVPSTSPLASLTMISAPILGSRPLPPENLVADKPGVQAFTLKGSSLRRTA